MEHIIPALFWASADTLHYSMFPRCRSANKGCQKLVCSLIAARLQIHISRLRNGKDLSSEWAYIVHFVRALSLARGAGTPAVLVQTFQCQCRLHC